MFHVYLGEFEIQAVLENCLLSITLLVEYLITMHKYFTCSDIIGLGCVCFLTYLSSEVFFRD